MMCLNLFFLNDTHGPINEDSVQVFEITPRRFKYLLYIRQSYI